ncbi:MAG: DUF983 domain-containing protein [Bacteroidetes bacterium]|nr:DUF983 domain-containing protein [Bacteroidota bacterium]
MPKESKPNFWWSMLTTKCPRCRRGPMFTNSNPWNLNQTLKMPDRCPECGQPYELEVGFWYGTGYVSYALTVLMSGLSLILWWLTIGLSTEDNRFFWWLGINSFLLIVLQPWLMRFSRAIYLYIFVKYDPDYKHTQTKTFDYQTEDYYIKKEGE